MAKPTARNWLKPVMIAPGRPRETWSEQEKRDAAHWALGPRFRAGLKPPPQEPVWYQPSPNDTAYFDTDQGVWVDWGPGEKPWPGMPAVGSEKQMPRHQTSVSKQVPSVTASAPAGNGPLVFYDGTKRIVV